MEEEMSSVEEETTSLIKIEDMSLEETQIAEQLYNSGGLDPVVEAGLKDYDERIQLENKLISKVLGPRGSDIRGYGEAVAKRVAFAIYALFNKQYGGKMGNLRAHMMTLEEERNRANTRYDELMGRVVGILGDEYRELRTDSKAFMEKLTTTLGEDLKESKIDQAALAERLADIDGLRMQIRTLEKEKEEAKASYESQISELQNKHKDEVKKLSSQIAKLDSRIEGLESEKAGLTGDLTQLRESYNKIKEAIAMLGETISQEELGEKLEEELYNFLLKDSKVPDMVIDGVGKFIDFKKYLGFAAKKGAEEAIKEASETLGNALS